MRRVRYSDPLTLCVVTGILLGGAVASARRSGQTVTAKTVWSGVYTTGQAAAGEKVYFAQCASCHGDDLAGRERAPALAGPQFLEAWHGKHLRLMLERIQEMPPGAPVSAADGLNVLAFLLYSSEMPAGSTALPADRATLAEITFERSKP